MGVQAVSERFTRMVGGLRTVDPHRVVVGGGGLMQRIKG
jgi:hypothetical protein